MRISRPCYDKMRRCPGWAGGGWTVSKDRNWCSGAYVNYPENNNGEPSFFWKFQFRQCDECKTVILPYITRFADPTYYWVRYTHRIRMWWWYWRPALVTKARRRENPDSGDIVLMPWRTGRKVSKNVYAIVGDEPSDDDIDIGRFDSESVAAIAVLQHNNALKRLSE